MRGQLSFAVLFIFLAVILAILFAVATPTIIDLVTGLYTHSEQVLADTHATAQQIQDPEVREAIEEAVSGAKDSTTEQISILSAFYEYGWAITLVVIVLIITIMARQTVEYSSRGGMV